ncbi:hypothetical protein HAX54_016338, partial [Datura stramonium]|nr:hypothetical protein [Datura stramonium]
MLSRGRSSKRPCEDFETPRRKRSAKPCEDFETDKKENMWDLIPDTFETALADLIDNSLQAVWSNHTSQRRLISLELTENRITLFDTGPGMDGSAENSLVN